MFGFFGVVVVVCVCMCVWAKVCFNLKAKAKPTAAHPLFFLSFFFSPLRSHLFSLCFNPLWQVWQSIRTKEVIPKMAGGADPILFHLYTSMIGFCLQAPLVLFIEVQRIVDRNDEDLITSPPSADFSFFSFFLSVFSGYLSNVFSLLFLTKVSTLTHSVSSTMRRLCVIVCSVLYFAKPVSAMNIAGMGLALGGFLWYSLDLQSIHS